MLGLHWWISHHALREQTHRTRNGSSSFIDRAWLLMVSQQVLSEVYRPRNENVPAAVWLLPCPSHQSRLSLSGAATADRILSVSTAVGNALSRPRRGAQLTWQ